MMNVIRGVIVLFVVGVSAPEVQAQRTYTADMEMLAAAGGGGGGFFDWIHKLSGPSFSGPAASLFYEFGTRIFGEPGLRLRYDYARRTARNKDGTVTPVTADITMETHQLTIEAPIIALPFYAGVGYAHHRFSGDFDGFTHWSVPAILGFRWRKPLFDVSGWAVVPVVTGSVHYFPKFEATDFAPISVTVSRDDSEAVLQASIGRDVRPPFLRRRR